MCGSNGLGLAVLKYAANLPPAARSFPSWKVFNRKEERVPADQFGSAARDTAIMQRLTAR